ENLKCSVPARGRRHLTIQSCLDDLAAALWQGRRSDGILLVGRKALSRQIGRRNTNRKMTRKCVCQRALAFLAITVAGFSTHVGSAQTPDLECAQLSNVPDDGSPLAIGLKVLAAKKIDPSQAESACRSALRADPTN